jgi:hypothetical protein
MEFLMGLLDQQSYAGYADEGQRLAVEPMSFTPMDAAKFIAEATPIIGDAMAAKEIYDELQKPDPDLGYVAVLGGAALLGLIPLIGEAASPAIKKVGKGLLDMADRIEVDPSVMGSTFGNIKLKSKSSDVPRNMPENNVLDAVDKLTPEQINAATKFERKSGFAKPRVGGGRAKDPALFTPFSSKKQTGIPPSEWKVKGRKLSSETVDPTFKTAEDLKNEGFTDMFGFVADGTISDTVIDEINDLKFSRPVMQQGGHEFGDKGKLGFASDNVALETKRKSWEKIAQEGGKPIVSPMTMGAAGGDFSMHQTMNLAQAILANADNIDPNFVPLRGAIKNNNRLLPEGMGLLSPELPAYLSTLKGGERAAFVKSLDTAPALAAGVPSVGAIRWATTAPELTNQPLLSSGYRAFQPDVENFLDYGNTHASYNATIDRVGNNMTMGDVRPWYMQFPDEAYPKMVASTPSGSNMLKTEALPKDIRGFQMNPNMSQKIDNEWVEVNMMYDEILKTQGRQAAELFGLDALVNRAQRLGNY